MIKMKNKFIKKIQEKLLKIKKIFKIKLMINVFNK